MTLLMPFKFIQMNWFYAILYQEASVFHKILNFGSSLNMSKIKVYSIYINDTTHIDVIDISQRLFDFNL